MTNGVEYLVTWNFRHIANAAMRVRIERACREAGYEPPVHNPEYDFNDAAIPYGASFFASVAERALAVEGEPTRG